MECCSVRILLQDCHKTLYTAKVELIPFKRLHITDQELLLWRASLKDSGQVVNVCMYHKEIFLGPRFERNLSISSIGYKQTSEDSSFTGIHYFLNHSREDLQVAGNDYIACKYDGRWWIGLILEVDTV